MHDWMKTMAAEIEKEKQRYQSVEAKPRVTDEESAILMIGPILELGKPEKLAAAALMMFIEKITERMGDRDTLRGSDSRPAKKVFEGIGEAVGIEMRLEDVKGGFQKKYKALPTQSRRLMLKRLLKKPLARKEAVDQLEDNKGDSDLAVDRSALLDDDDPVMIQSTTLQIGAWFTNLILKTAKLPVTMKDPVTGISHTELQPAASHGWSFVAGKRVGHIRANIELIRRLQTELVGGFISKPLPMLCEPVAWTGFKKGAYLRKDPASASIAAVRMKDSSKSQFSHLDEADRQGHLGRLYHGMNVLSRVPWRVNRPLLKVLIESWNTGERVGKLAPADAETYINEKDGPMPPLDTTDRTATLKWNQRNQIRRNDITGLRSQRAYQNFQLEVARAFADEDAFYTPHNVDFRGRAYPIPPYFNHMGADYVRALFNFAKGKELGSTGLRWLKIQVANQYGFDKEKLDDRVEFAENHLAEIYDSVENPLDGKRWWLTAGHPWQCLAACIELKAALDSPVPEKYVSHLPIQQDGTCNGLQHYAALGGDKIGAAQVNLLPGDKPADIYSAVKDLVVQEVHADAENGHNLAQILDGRITRKVVKQPVMTNVYGVTYHGAKEQVRKQLMEIIPTTAVGDTTYAALSAYVARHIFTALGRMFSGAQAIQLWLGDCGARISQSINPDQIENIISKRKVEKEAQEAARAAEEAAKQAAQDDVAYKPKKKGPGRTKERKDVKVVNGSAKFKRPLLSDTKRGYDQEDFQFKAPIIWTTPLGMPVVQPYRASKVKYITSSLQRVMYEEASLSDPVSKRKQLQAFPPNFIHSLDSSHMMLSAIRSHGKGLTFSSVHDSFWTHAADVPVMNTILRDAFIEMHSEDIVGRLREEMQKRYANFLYSAPIQRNSELGRRVTELRKSQGRLGQWQQDPKVTDQKQIDELIEEYTRQQLLKSEDAEERAKGQAMITPASLWEQASESDKVTLPVLDEKDISVLGSQDDRSANAQNEREEAGLAGGGAEDAEVPGSEGAEATAEGDENEIDLLDDANSDADSDAAAVDDEEGEAAVDELEDGKTQEKKLGRPPNATKTVRRMHIWLPLDFKDTPEKGDFDVAELKKSVYFFS